MFPEGDRQRDGHRAAGESPWTSWCAERSRRRDPLRLGRRPGRDRRDRPRTPRPGRAGWLGPGRWRAASPAGDQPLPHRASLPGVSPVRPASHESAGRVLEPACEALAARGSTSATGGTCSRCPAVRARGRALVLPWRGGGVLLGCREPPHLLPRRMQRNAPEYQIDRSGGMLQCIERAFPCVIHLKMCVRVRQGCSGCLWTFVDIFEWGGEVAGSSASRLRVGPAPPPPRPRASPAPTPLRSGAGTACAGCRRWPSPRTSTLSRSPPQT